MKSLSENWLVEPVFDYEYKTYELMAYTKGIEAEFEKSKFYPYLDELKKHLYSLEEFTKIKDGISQAMRTDLVEVDLKRLAMMRASLPDNGGIIAELDGIVNFAKVRLEQLRKVGVQKFDDVAALVEIAPLGMLGSSRNAGFLFFRRNGEINVYSYHFRLVRRPFDNEAYKDVCTRFHSKIAASRFASLQNIKWDFIKALPPMERISTNVYTVEAQISLPQWETLLPLVKLHLIKTAA